MIMSPSTTPWYSNPGTLRSILGLLVLFNVALIGWSLVASRTPYALTQPLRFQPQVSSVQPINRPTIDVVSISAPKGDKVAMIIETRMLPNLIPLILHFSSVLGPSWHVILFTFESVWTMPPSILFQRAVAEKRISIRFLPDWAELTHWMNVNVFLTRPWLWEQVQDADRALLFQTDSIICSNANVTMEDFMEWDYIGAPVNKAIGEGYNGGLSLRNPKMILQLLNGPLNDYDESLKRNFSKLLIEDQFYYHKLKQIPGAKLPNVETAKKFSVETIWYDRPLGFHAPKVWNTDRMDAIREYCPEVELINRKKLTTTETATTAALTAASTATAVVKRDSS